MTQNIELLRYKTELHINTSKTYSWLKYTVTSHPKNNNELQHRNLNSSIRNMQQQQKAKTKSITADY
jgi:hypothetical protein